MRNSKFKFIVFASALCVTHFAFLICAKAQETPPVPSAPKSVNIPAVAEKTLPNGLKIAVVERKNVPLVSVRLLIKSGAETEAMQKAGLADLTASLLTKGTKTRSATQIAEDLEFLGGSINSGAGWNSSNVSINIMSDKLDQALAIMSDTVLNPAFKPDELDLLKSQNLDGLKYNLKQPGFLANYVASVYSFGEHPAGGTPESLNGLTRDDVVSFHQSNYEPQNAVLIFVGDIAPEKASELAAKYFGKWAGEKSDSKTKTEQNSPSSKSALNADKVLVIDLPNSGQAAVSYVKKLQGIERARGDSFYPASVLNSVLGGGYSSRLNQEIRIKRGLSYGAGSRFGWRNSDSDFSTSTQTKNESAAEVADLVIKEIEKLSSDTILDIELVPRKAVLTGGFGRNIETNDGLAAQIADLYSFGISASELNSYIKNVQGVSDKQIQDFAKKNLNGGSIVIVGDYSIFKSDLAKRFPNMKIEIVKAGDLNLNKENLQNS